MSKDILDIQNKDIKIFWVYGDCLKGTTAARREDMLEEALRKWMEGL